MEYRPSSGGVRGQQGITEAFEAARLVRSAALMPYFTLGYPDQRTSIEVVKAFAPYSDLLELGLPFSDPIADGPTIQRSTQRALEVGTTTESCLDAMRELRGSGIDTPALLMGYYNPILAYGEERFVSEAAEAGADGFIIPDLPPEEAETLQAATARAGLSLIYFLAPTTNPNRLEEILGLATGFLYMVSVTGVTGARSTIREDLSTFVRRVKARTSVPVAVGFGISTPEQAGIVSQFADGVIVGSALINAVDEATDKPAAAASFVKRLQATLTLAD